MLVYPFKFLWHDMSSSEEIASKKFSRTEYIANDRSLRSKHDHYGNIICKLIIIQNNYNISFNVLHYFKRYFLNKYYKYDSF